MAHETAIHRWDAERAAGLGPDGGPPAGFSPELADGVEEVLDVMFPRRFDYSGFGATGQTVHLHATDGRPEEPGEVADHDQRRPHRLRAQGHHKGDVAAAAAVRSLPVRVEPDRTERLDVVATTCAVAAGRPRPGSDRRRYGERRSQASIRSRVAVGRHPAQPAPPT